MGLSALFLLSSVEMYPVGDSWASPHWSAKPAGRGLALHVCEGIWQQISGVQLLLSSPEPVALSQEVCAQILYCEQPPASEPRCVRSYSSFNVTRSLWIFGYQSCFTHSHTCTSPGSLPSLRCCLSFPFKRVSVWPLAAVLTVRRACFPCAPAPPKSQSLSQSGPATAFQCLWPI